MTTDSITAATPAATPIESRPQVSLWTIWLAFLQVGLTAFGFAILQKLKKLVLTNHWLTEEEMNEGLALVQLYPGPMMIDFTAYAGYKVRGVPGAVVATLGFIIPTLILMLALSAAYFAAGSLPWVQPLFLGLEALVVGVLINVVLEFGQRAIKGRLEAAVMLAAFAALVFKANAVLIVLIALAAGAVFIRPQTAGKPAKEQPRPWRDESVSTRRWAGIALALVVVMAGVGLAWSLNSEVGRLGLSLFKIGAIAFGNGMTILPLIQADAVDTHHWLTMNQFVDGIALSQITPGPFLIIATFIGYKLGGMWGGLLATFAMFAPSFVMTLIFTEVFSRVRNLAVVKGALAGVLAAFVGLLAVVLIRLGGIGIGGPASMVMAAGAFVAIRSFKWDLLWVFAGGLAVWSGFVMLGMV
ncbi:MAG: chromate efflux transporter [Chloroflexi bacterium]|nr:MAG: chromate efflux transporter [Chloroflexota bacterium]